MAESEVATFREQQKLQEQATYQGLNGLAMVASHSSITARMEQGIARIVQLQQEGKHEEAQALWLSERWWEI